MDDFVDSLTCKQDKKIQMGSLKSLKVHALVENENSSIKFKQKIKFKKDPNPEDDSFHKFVEETSNQKRGNSIKDKVMCGYCNG